ncbi:proline-rich extensin-like protein EPR1 [Punica granatum]|uniref:Proline-rich extensin-like protein EPR1 n=1 Tax=Punica granatum TaxID=22663 RepID=A0A6P8DKP8_PUNGR|nr:proline-rich extensin-like protein EPR1 [Punica granatum]
MEEIDPPIPPEEVTPSVSVQSQPPITHAPPLPTPTRMPSGYSSAPSVYLPPSDVSTTSSGVAPPLHVPPPMYMPPTPAPPYSPSSNDVARITVLEGTVNQMAVDVAELMALLKESNVGAISVPTHFPAIVPPLTHVPAVYPVLSPLLSTLPATLPPPPMTVPIMDLAILMPPPTSLPAPGLIYTASLPTILSTTSTHAPAPITKPFPFPTPQPHISLPRQTPLILNIPYYNSGTQAMAAPETPPTFTLPTVETEHERRMKRTEEMIVRTRM